MLVAPELEDLHFLFPHPMLAILRQRELLGGDRNVGSIAERCQGLKCRMDVPELVRSLDPRLWCNRVGSLFYPQIHRMDADEGECGVRPRGPDSRAWPMLSLGCAVDAHRDGVYPQMDRMNADEDQRDWRSLTQVLLSADLQDGHR